MLRHILHITISDILPDTNVEDVTSAALAAWEKADGIVSFVNYVEGIYVGYRFFETAYVEAEENGFDFDYDETVMYPFGYGLSYTDFSQEMGGIQENDGIISVDVTVTNTVGYRRQGCGGALLHAALYKRRDRKSGCESGSF